ncbi:hypothetical protein [Modestobacter sp. I12A-02662]|uniref:hypothetical protein n=1 Tax=Modestobacter sp. I12A-02662 TaxID=1730496 RepID=UPI0034DEC211
MVTSCPGAVQHGAASDGTAATPHRRPVPVAVALLGRRARRRGIGGSVLAPLEEIWDPVANRTNIEIQVQAERAAPAPAPGDRPV